ncbi:hypothetical protein LJK88_20605 [Paenibacillus sp. P26]|nr:hypothetical protein LJK88_20605 [Paenibacillus sp. P26]UUZ95963.1 hypothetical protein LJK87_17260 [Paenibacillus sp. P25]
MDLTREETALIIAMRINGIYPAFIVLDAMRFMDKGRAQDNESNDYYHKYMAIFDEIRKASRGKPIDTRKIVAQLGLSELWAKQQDQQQPVDESDIARLAEKIKAGTEGDKRAMALFTIGWIEGLLKFSGPDSRKLREIKNMIAAFNLVRWGER